MRPGGGWLTGLAVVTALAALGALLAYASARHGSVALAYGRSGNSCRSLTASSAEELARALLPVRILLAGWVAITGVLVIAPAARSDFAWGKPFAIAGGVGAVALAAAVQWFAGTDRLSAMIPLVLLWLTVGLAAAGVAIVAAPYRRQPVARTLALYAGWLVACGVALPLVVLDLTDNGAILSC
jgi:hypothetical protein